MGSTKSSLVFGSRYRKACIRWVNVRESIWRRENEGRWRAEHQESMELRQSGWLDFALEPPPRDLFVEMRRACSWHDIRRASDLPAWADTQNLFWRPLQHAVHSLIANDATDAPHAGQAAVA